MIRAFDAFLPDADASDNLCAAVFSSATNHGLLMRPICRTIYLMPLDSFNDAKINSLAARTLAVFEQVIGASRWN